MLGQPRDCLLPRRMWGSEQPLPIAHPAPVSRETKQRTPPHLRPEVHRRPSSARPGQVRQPSLGGLGPAVPTAIPLAPEAAPGIRTGLARDPSIPRPRHDQLSADPEALSSGKARIRLSFRKNDEQVIQMRILLAAGLGFGLAGAAIAGPERSAHPKPRPAIATEDTDAVLIQAFAPDHPLLRAFGVS